MALYPMRVEKQPNGTFDILGKRGERLVAGLLTHIAADEWISDNQPDWPIDWRRLKTGQD